MKLTSAEANKMLRQLNDEREKLLKKEERSCTFLAVMGEDPDTVRPDYDYEAVQEELGLLESRIRKLKHEIFRFNLNTQIPELGMSIDECLVLIPQLTALKAKLADMTDRLPKEREITSRIGGSNIVDYRYANYDIARAESDYEAASQYLAKAQTALDKANSTLSFEVDI